MPAKTKAAKSRITVEEVTETPEPEVVKTVEETLPAAEPPKVSSFSQLDSMKSESEPLPIPEATPKRGILEGELETVPEQKEDTGPTPKENLPEAPTDTPNPDDKPQASSEEIKEWLKEVRPDTSKINEKSGGPDFKVVLLIILILLLLGAVVGGIFYYKKGVTDTPQKEVVQEETQVITPTQSPEEKVEKVIDLKTLSVNVLNGSGKSGEAGKVKALLTKAGFTDAKVTTGNADRYDYTETSASLKENLPDSVFAAIQNSLEDNYVVVKSEKELESSSSYDITITVGSQKPS